MNESQAIIPAGRQFPNERTVDKLEHGVNVASERGYFGPCRVAVLTAWTARGIERQLVRLGVDNPRFEVVEFVPLLGTLFPRLVVIWTEAMDQADLDHKAEIARRVEEEIRKEKIAEAEKTTEEQKKQEAERAEKKKTEVAATEEIRRLAEKGRVCEKHHGGLLKKLRQAAKDGKVTLKIEDEETKP